jgi:hypothetical protein
MLVKNHSSGRVVDCGSLAPSEDAACGRHAQVIRRVQEGRVVRGPSLRLPSPRSGLGEHHWITRGEANGRVLAPPTVSRAEVARPLAVPLALPLNTIEPQELEALLARVAAA